MTQLLPLCRQWGGGTFCEQNQSGLPPEIIPRCFAENGTMYPNGTCYNAQVRR